MRTHTHTYTYTYYTRTHMECINCNHIYQLVRELCVEYISIIRDIIARKSLNLVHRSRIRVLNYYYYFYCSTCGAPSFTRTSTHASNTRLKRPQLHAPNAKQAALKCPSYRRQLKWCEYMYRPSHMISQGHDV